jgi:hypothetical protein
MTKRINLHYEYDGIQFGVVHILAAEKLLDYYRDQFPDIEFNKINYLHENNPPPIKEQDKFKHNHFSSLCIIIENDENKKYFVISLMDVFNFLPVWKDFNNCVEIFPSCGVHIDDFMYEPLETIKYTPFTCPQSFYKYETKAEELYRLNLPKITPNKPYFRSSTPYLFRKYIQEINDSRFDVHSGQVPYDEFISDMSKKSIVIDINGVAEISNRTILAISLGCALIRPKLSIKFHNEFIPDFHYAAVKCNDLSNYEELADAYIERFEELKKDKDLVHFLSINGRKWYEENSTLESFTNLCKKLIDLKKLF